jgi:hypothetical protein
MAQNSFVYDPSANIREGLKDVSTNIGTAFSNIIAQKQQDLALADKVFQNLDAIKEETAAIGSTRINEAIKSLTANASNTMFKDGKVSFEGIGQIMNGVSQVKQLKNYWSNAAELKKQYLQLGASTNKDMTSLSSFVSQMDPLIAQNEGGSIEDLKKKLSSLYDSHLDYTNMGRDKIASLYPVDKYVGEMENEKKGITEYSFSGPSRLFVFDTKTSKPILAPPTPVLDPATGQPVIDELTGKPKMLSSLDKAKAALGPEFLAKYKGHMGVSPALVTDEAATMQILNSFATAPAFKETKSFEKIQTEKNEANISNIEAAYAGRKNRLQIQSMEQSIRTAKAAEEKYKSAGAKSPFPKNYVRPIVSKADKNGNRTVSLTKPITISATGANYVAGKNKDGSNIIRRGLLDPIGKGATEQFEVVKITRDKTGHFVATGYKSTGSMREKGAAKQIVLSKSDYNDFVNKLGGIDAVNRFSNSLALTELGLPDIPDTYLNIEQDEKPDNDFEFVP